MYANKKLKPVQQQQGAVQCAVCKRWFRSNDGLEYIESSPHNSPEGIAIPAEDNIDYNVMLLCMRKSF